jgi:hypothetical protein
MQINVVFMCYGFKYTLPGYQVGEGYHYLNVTNCPGKSLGKPLPMKNS